MQINYPITEETLQEFTRILQRYKAGRSRTEARILASENWWKLRNEQEEDKRGTLPGDGGFRSVSGWLHNVIVSKHADAMEAYPEPVILPRESQDRKEARTLGAIIPCILEQNRFEDTYSDAMWQKLKTGTACYKVIWDPTRLEGLGDIAVERVNLLNLYWEPGISDIQKSRYLFHTQLQDRDTLLAAYPQLKDSLKSGAFVQTKFSYDDPVTGEDQVTVIEVYYRVDMGGRKVLHYCKYAADQLLYATCHDPALGDRGLYDHGQYPFVLDTLFPVEGSPCGYGYVDLCRNPQTEIDMLKTSFVRNAMVGATPRYFSRGDGAVNEEEFLDLSKPIVHVNNTGDDALRQIGVSRLDGVYISVLDRTIDELRQTSGNTETSTGNVSSGVTAASAIAALQEASGKGSRDSNRTSYRAYSRIVELCIELIRQFYTTPRSFRILGSLGQDQFIGYTNSHLVAQSTGGEYGESLRLPVFDIKVGAQKKNAYTRVSQNELALQLFQMGFFNPQLAEQAMMCLEVMDFDGKQEVTELVAGNLQRVRQQELSAAVAGKLPHPEKAQVERARKQSEEAGT